MALTVMKFPIFAILASIGHLHTSASENSLLEAKPMVLSVHPKRGSWRDFTKVYLIFPDFPQHAQAGMAGCQLVAIAGNEC